jgi:hypothetical protein
MPSLFPSSADSKTWPTNDPAGRCVTIVRIMTVVLFLLVSLNHSEAIEDETGPVETRDHWFVIRFDGQPVGYEHVQSRQVHHAGEVTRLCQRTTQLSLKRLGQNLTLRASLQTRQTPDGRLLSFNLHRVDGAGARMERSGELMPDSSVFHIEEKINATRREFNLRVPDDVRSPIFSQWLPEVMQSSSDRIVISVLFPESAAVADITATHGQKRNIRIGNENSVQARRIRFYPRSDPTKSTTFYVSDVTADPPGDSATGRRPTLANQERSATSPSAVAVLRQEKSILGGTLTLDAASASEALSAASETSLDLTVRSLVPVNRLFSNNNRTQLVLVLSVVSGFLPKIPETIFQKVQLLNDTTARITLLPSIVGRQRTLRTSNVLPPSQSATHWMPLQDPTLQRMAVVASAGQTDPREVCRRLASFVHSKMRHSAFSTGHTWVEALIGSEWIPFDSTVGSTETNVTHLKLADSEMPDEMSSGIALFLPVLDLAGRAEIRVISDR